MGVIQATCRREGGDRSRLVAAVMVAGRVRATLKHPVSSGIIYMSSGRPRIRTGGFDLASVAMSDRS